MQLLSDVILLFALNTIVIGLAVLIFLKALETGYNIQIKHEELWFLKERNDLIQKYNDIMEALQQASKIVEDSIDKRRKEHEGGKQKCN